MVISTSVFWRSIQAPAEAAECHAASRDPCHRAGNLLDQLRHPAAQGEGPGARSGGDQTGGERLGCEGPSPGLVRLVMA